MDTAGILMPPEKQDVH